MIECFYATFITTDINAPSFIQSESSEEYFDDSDN